MELDLDRVRENAKKATTEDLLDRVTVYRIGLEPEALPMIMEELRSRGIRAEDIVAHERSRGVLVYDDTGSARKCSLCPKPAVAQQWGWHRLFGKVPLIPRVFYLCAEHCDASWPQAANL